MMGLGCRLTPIVPRLSELLGTTVLKADDCIGDAVKQKTSELKNGEVRRCCGALQAESTGGMSP